MAEKSVRVRVPMIVDPEGRWMAYGCDGMTDEESLGTCWDAIGDYMEPARVYYVEATVSLPAPEVVEGEVDRG